MSNTTLNTIRFRIFEGKQKYIFTLEDLLDARTLANRGGNFKFPAMNSSEAMVAHRSTGLMDIGNNEIFEGDILQEYICVEKSGRPILRHSVVVYRTDSDYVTMHSQFGVYIIDSFLNLSSKKIPVPIGHECKIIGNIIENPELLSI